MHLPASCLESLNLNLWELVFALGATHYNLNDGKGKGCASRGCQDTPNNFRW